MAARKSKNQPSPTTETLRDLEESGDRIAEWAAENAAVVLAVIAGVLVVAAGAGIWLQHSTNQQEEAVNALAIAEGEYRQAMGANPYGGPVPEPANAELAERTRREFATRFEAVGAEHSGRVAGAVALLEAGKLHRELGDLDAATGNFESARDDAGDSAIGALAATQLAQLAESRGDMAAAAEAFESAAEVRSYPLRAGALADAARCWAAADQADRALAVYQRLEAEFPDERVAPHIKSLLDEIRAQQRS